MLPFKFYLITDEAHVARAALPAPQRPGRQTVGVLPGLAAAGLRALQVREKDRPPREQADFAAQLLASLGERRGDVRLFLNDRADLALSLGLDGVHLREDSLPLERQAPGLRAALMWGVSTHSAAGVQAAQAAGADFVTFGPVYATPSKAPYGEPVGLGALEAAAAASRVPILALGGVTPQRARDCLAAGARGVAAISAIWDAPDPITALREFEEALGGL